MKNILVTGSNGQLGSELKELAQNSNFIFTDVNELNILDEQAVLEIVKTKQVDCIINCAAYTAVDKAEEDKDFAFQLNAVGPENLAKAAHACNAKFIHVSTDFVFDGKAHRPLLETDTPNPISVYGSTKLAGEEKVLAILPSSIILRTSWLYSAFGGNFVKTMIRLGKERDELGVIFDQIGSPTWAHDLAKAIVEILDIPTENLGGVYHYSNEGVASWFDFTKAIHEIANIECKVKPIETSAYPTPAARPHYSVMNKGKFKDTFNIEIPYWKESLEKCIAQIIKSE